MLEDRSLLSVGNLDLTFNQSGLLVASALGSNAQANAIAVLGDQNDATSDPILLAGRAANPIGQDFFLARLDKSGSIGAGDVAYADFGVNDEATALQFRNNLAFVAGTTGAVGSRDVALARFNTTSALVLDSTFGIDGRVTFNINGDDVLKAIVLTNTSIVAVGTTTGAGGHDIFVARFSATDGQSLGVTIIDVNGGDDQANAVAVDSAGNIFVAGATTHSAGSGGNRDFLLVKLTPDGVLDSSFGHGGITTLDFSNGLPGDVAGSPVANPSYDDVANALVLQGSKIILAGTANNGRFDFLALARFNANGTLDTTFAPGQETFGPQGTITTAIGPSSDIAFGLTIQPNGKLVVAGRSLRDEVNLDQSDVVLARYFADGTTDTTFGFAGRLRTQFPGSSSEARAIAFEDNGTLVAAGDFKSGAVSQVAVARYEADIRPVAQPNSFSIASDGFSDPINIVALDNDFDPDQFDKLKIVKLTVPETGGDVTVLPGTATLLPEGTLFTDGTFIKFTPKAGYSGTFRFSYTVSDGWLTTKSSIDVNVLVGTQQLAGDRDSSFGAADHRVLTQFNFSPSTAAAAVKLGSDTIVAGTITTTLASGATRTDVGLARYKADGSLDTTFGTNGIVVMDLGVGGAINLNETVKAVLIQNLGGQDYIVVAGSVDRDTNFADSVTANDFFATRFTTSGSLDATFGVNGVQTVNLGGDDQAFAALVQPVAGQNDIVIGGITDVAGTEGGQDFGLVRLNEAGTRDLTFGGTGTALTSFRGIDQLRALALQDTKIIAVGAADVPTLAVDVAKGRDIAVARYNADGSLDTGFGTLGKVIQDFTKRDDALAVAIDPATMNILVGGFIAPSGNTNLDSRDLAVVRFLVNGTLDTSFGGQHGINGVTTVDFAAKRDEARGIVINGDKIFAAGLASVDNPHSITPNLNADFALAVLALSDGHELARTTTDFLGLMDSAVAVVTAGSGVIAAGNAFGRDGIQGFGLVKYDASATIDTTFGGKVPGFGEVFRAPGMATSPSLARAVVVQADGKIVAGGVASSQADRDFALVRYLADGSIDTTFGIGGTVLLNVFSTGGGDDQINDLVLDGTNLLAAGTATLNGRKVFAIARFASNGLLDTSFGTGGIAFADFGSDAEALSLSKAPNGDFVLSGFVTQNGRHVLALARFNASGQLTGLDGDGKVTLDLGVNAEARGGVVQADGKIAVTGVAGNDVLLARFNAGGTLDPTFNASGPTPGIQRVNVSGNADGANKIAIDSMGRFVVAGFTTTDNGDTDYLAARFLANGSLDMSFGSAGTGLVSLEEFGAGNDQASGLTLETVSGEQRIVLAGSANFAGQDAFGLARLTSTGLLDKTFGSNGLIRTFLTAGSAKAFDVTTDSLGRLVVAGSGVTTTNGPTRFAVFRYLGDAAGNFRPLTVDDVATTAEGQPVTIPVLLNDQDANGDTLMIVDGSVTPSGPVIGSIAISADKQSLIYTPPMTGTGTDTFTFMVTDGANMVPSKVTVTIAPVPTLSAIKTAIQSSGVTIQDAKFINLGGPKAVRVVPPNNAFGPDGFLYLSTGSTDVAFDGTLSGVDNGNRLGGNRIGAYDATILQIDLTILPGNANFLSFDFSFLSNEYPDSLGRNANDAFIAELYDFASAPSTPDWSLNPVDGEVIDRYNFAYDTQTAAQEALTVRSNFFSDSRVVTLTGTGYNAATPLLRAGHDVVAGQKYRLFLSLFDVGDDATRGQIDSAVFLKKLQATQVTTADPHTLKGATQGPEAGEDFLALPNPQPGVAVNVPVLQNDLAFDGGPLQIIGFNTGETGSVNLTGPTTLTYTPSIYFTGSDTFTYTVMDSRGLTSTATVSVYSLVSQTTSQAASPSKSTTAQSTNFVSQAAFSNNAPGSPDSVFTLADYLRNPTGVPFRGTAFFDVYAPRSGPTDRVDLYVNDPTGQGELFYFNGQSWQPVRSSGNKPPERIGGQLHYVLDAFSFPRVTFLFGTVFDMPIATPNTQTTTVSNASAGPGATTSTVTLRSDVQLSLGLTSSQSSVVQNAESSLSLRQNVNTNDASNASTGGNAAAGSAASGSSDKPPDETLNMDVVWLLDVNPPVGELLIDQMQTEGKLDPDLLKKAKKTPPLIDTVIGDGTSPGTDVVPEEEELETEALDWFSQASVLDSPPQEARIEMESGSEEVPAWAWAALLAAPTLQGLPKRRQEKRLPITFFS